jgi:general secretion pathway protein M
MLQQYWQNATPREHLLIALMAAIICSALVFALLIQPAWRTVQAAPATLTRLDGQVLTMRAQAASLRAGATTPALSAAPASATMATADKALAGADATVSETRGADGVTVTFKGVDSNKLAQWLAQPAVQQRLLQINLTRDPAGGRAGGSVLLRAPA